LTTSDPLRAALRQERRLLLAFCFLFAALLAALVMNGLQAERIRWLEAEHATDRAVIADMADRYNTALSTAGDQAIDGTRSLREIMHDYHKDKEGQ
jgi:hypothetical protein